MEFLEVTGRKRQNYEIEFSSSVLWECALGIAAITNQPLIDSLEKPKKYWESIRESFSKDMKKHLDYLEAHNTWKALLLTLHAQSFISLNEWSAYIDKLSHEEFRYVCLPYLGEGYQLYRKEAANKNKEALRELQLQIEQDNFLHRYIEFIGNCEVERVKFHMKEVMSGWYEGVVKDKESELNEAFNLDIHLKKQSLKKMEATEFVKWVTGGIEYKAEPSVYKVLLIPQYIYRPWNIVADLEGTKVIYYPISNISLNPEDKYVPDQFLILKYKALGDEVRLRMVKMLYEKDYSLQQLTDMLVLGKSTVHHHLKLLRSAQLVKKKGSLYTLQKQSLAHLTDELQHYLNQ
ncbi:ArsR/SmtB family transcription factor [Alkalihalobacillus trypoxylicola]|uniref:ArsR family transcriptional regulator n=1 Tax=Alkalihalobacillus trypoxylicola TaxID=519424 RepID=A0A161P8J3_9BACI|nr:ArsR family transcriptional regulator [Alkalihalobacillus trypoxylicola]KYG27673.1 ArsR family transcriptional regulator [Alkalihalobacillus trypoxylicola]